MSVLDVLTILVLLYVGRQLVLAARLAWASRQRMGLIVRGLRPRHFLGAVPTFAAVLAVAIVLIQLPVLSFGWWTAIGGEGNPVIGATDRTSGSVLEIVVPVVFLSLLFVALPLLVEREELIFRSGAENRTLAANVRRALEFGLAHAVIGIPIGAALALSIGGAYLTAMYLLGWRRTHTRFGALLESTRAHLAYNLVILTLVFVTILLAYAFGL
ncbi:MAG: hypothetical protein U0V73_06655 [Acidimicrobiia bacterium]